MSDVNTGAPRRPERHLQPVRPAPAPSTTRAPVSAEVRSIMAGAQALEAALDENESLRLNVASLEQQLKTTLAEGEGRSRDLRRALSERDHYLRAYTALAAQIEALGESFIKAVHSARSHGYGGRPRTNQEGSEGEPIPKFLTQTREQPADIAEQSDIPPIDLDRFSRALRGEDREG